MSKLIAPIGRVIVKVDVEGKNTHTFQDGTKIRLERKMNNLNKRYTEPVNAIVVSSDFMQEGSACLIHHNSTHDSHRIFNYTNLSGNEIADTTKYYSLPISQIFFYKEPGQTEWKPTQGFATALRVFKPYQGILQNIEPTQLKDTLFVTSGIYKGKAVRTVKASDYLIHFQGEDGVEQQLIRFREEKIEDRECEVVAILHDVTEEILNGEYLVGLTTNDCKSLTELV